ncbi:MAG TPA: hypothetical protein VJP39_01325 [Gaiellaceae bacterium]|nr:hypothetical protein [Gaiellaceae bacterium]
MYRTRVTVQVLYGRFKEHLETCHRINELARSRGWTESMFWVPTVGLGNQMVIETDYPDFATFEREGEAFYSDPEAMELLAGAIGHLVESSARSELLNTLSTPA